MSATELAFRALRALQARIERARAAGTPPAARADLAAAPSAWINADAPLDGGACIVAAERISEGWLEVLGLGRIDLGSPPRWNRDAKTGIEAPLGFGKDLDYRDPDVVGDIRYVWEPNRHAHLVTLAQAYALTGHAKYAAALAEQLDSWLVACPYRYGPNWSSSLEVARRLANWSTAWQLLGGITSPFLNREQSFRARWLGSIYQHAEYVAGWLSLHSSANHHLIGEGAGLLLAGLAWPHWPRARDWRAAGKAVLEREALAQVAPDGVHREQSLACHQLVLDALLVCLLAGRRNAEHFSPAFEERLEAMLDYLASVTDAAGNVPRIGDGDDAFFLDISPRASSGSLLATGAVVFKRGDFKLKAARLDDRARLLLGGGVEDKAPEHSLSPLLPPLLPPPPEAEFEQLDAEKTRLPLRQAFPEGGSFVLGCEFDTPDEIRIVADAGPLGYRSIAAHGHADALSFTLSAGGHEFFVDPGAYAWHAHPVWRQYFRGTGAHNTLRIDGLDQSVSGGSFMWLQKARAACSLWLSSADKDSFEGWHDGYMRLDDPVKHRRLIELDKKARRVLIEDRLEMADEHEVELLFHCSERCSLKAAPGGYTIRQEGSALRLTLPEHENASTTVYSGSVAPIFGWVSRAYDSRRPAPTVVWRARLSGSIVLRTEIGVPRSSAA
jgi:Heparinase II/III-like protein/Heparinase II/III N-terminus